MTEEERQEALIALHREEQLYNFVAKAKEQGITEGRQFEKVTIVKSMLTKQCDWDFISSVCGITEQEYPELVKLATLNESHPLT